MSSYKNYFFTQIDEEMYFEQFSSFIIISFHACFLNATHLQKFLSFLTSWKHPLFSIFHLMISKSNSVKKYPKFLRVITMFFERYNFPLITLDVIIRLCGVCDSHINTYTSPFTTLLLIRKSQHATESCDVFGVEGQLT